MPAKTYPAAAPRRSTPRSGFLNWRNVMLAVLAVTGVTALFYFTELDWRDVPGLLEGVSRPLALVIMATLPLVGFPISAVYLAAGAIFGPWLGLLVVAGVTAVHLVVTQLLAHTLLREPIERLRKKWSHKIPEVPAHEHASLVAMIVIVPGLPYFVRNCVLALSKAPWGVVLGVGLPVYVVRSCATIFLGDVGSNPSVTAVVILGTIYAVKLAVSFLLFRRLKHSLHRKKTRAAAAAR